MKKYRAGFAPILVIALVGLVLILGAGWYFAQQRSQLETGQSEATDATSSTSTPAGEDSSQESFKNQPGAVKVIKKQGELWVVTVNLLTRNPSWIPGGDLAGGDFFMDLNPKLRELVVSSETKTYNCSSTEPTDLVNTADFITSLEKDISRNKIEMQNRVERGGFGASVSDWATAYFDIQRSNITAIYQQCLP